MDLARRARTKDARRLVGIDVARCLALLGMMSTHILPGYVEGGVPWSQQLAGGRASALFGVLAGVSLALMSGRQHPVHGRDRVAASAGLAIRAVIIAAIGILIGGLPAGVAVILTYYGLLFLLGLPFLGLRARWLAALSVAWLLVVPVLSHALRPLLPEPTLDNPTVAGLSDPWQLLTELTFTGYYPTVPWLAYLLAGMAIGRLDLRRPRTAALLVVIGAGTALTAWAVSRTLTSRSEAAAALRSTYDPGFTPTQPELETILAHGLFGTTPTDSWWWLAVVSPHTATPFDLAQTIGSALVVVGLCLLAARLWPRGFAVLFGAGAMTLTLYTLHVIMLTPPVWPEETASSYLPQVVVILAIGAAFALPRLRGPLEAVVALFAKAASSTVRLVSGGPSEPVEREQASTGSSR